MMSVCFYLSFTDENRRFFHVPVRKKVMLLGIYSQIKEQVSTREVAEHYGYKVSRKGMMRCPFHEDKTPSMKVDKNFVCFGCQEKGDVIRFASKLFGLPPYAAAGKLIEDMGLTVFAENRPEVQPGIRQKAKRERTEKQQFEQAVNRIYNVFCDYLHLLNHWAEEYAPRSPTEDLHPLFVEAMHKRDYVGYFLDLLLYGSREDKAFVVIEKGKEVPMQDEKWQAISDLLGTDRALATAELSEKASQKDTTISAVSFCSVKFWRAEYQKRNTLRISRPICKVTSPVGSSA